MGDGGEDGEWGDEWLRKEGQQIRRLLAVSENVAEIALRKKVSG